MNLRNCLVTCLLLLVGSTCSLQSDSTRNWDNQAYLGNKVTFGSDNWKYAAELQIRLKDNMQNLERWFVEGVVTYLASERLEFVPDIRFTVKPDKVEIRPGFGIFYKHFVGKARFVHQAKWQVDIDASDGNGDHAARYASFINHPVNEKLIANFTAGVAYRWREDFKGVQFVRFGPGMTYVVSKQHSINFNYFLSAENGGEIWRWSGIPVVQLIININKDYKYLPARFFSL